MLVSSHGQHFQEIVGVFNQLAAVIGENEILLFVPFAQNFQGCGAMLIGERSDTRRRFIGSRTTQPFTCGAELS